MPEHKLSLAPKTCIENNCGEDAPIVRAGFTTLVGFLGPHDGNCVEGVFECSNGHRFLHVTQYICICGWSGVRDCTTHSALGVPLDKEIDPYADLRL